MPVEGTVADVGGDQEAHGEREVDRGVVAVHALDQPQVIERRPARSGEHQPHERRQVRELDRVDEVDDAVQLRELCCPDRDGHDTDEEQCGDTSAKAEHQQRAANELDTGHEDGIRVWSRDVERGKELRDIVEIVELAPPGRDEYEAEREPNE